MPGTIYVITGVPAAGKSTVADELLSRFPFGYHIDVDGLREMVVSGLASPLGWTEETDRQFALADRAATVLADIYSEAGFTVAIEAAMDPEYVDEDYVIPLGAERVVRVALNPSLESLLERNASRTKSFDTTILEPMIRDMHRQFSGADWNGWLVLDTSDETAAQTTDRILARDPARPG